MRCLASLIPGFIATSELVTHLSLFRIQIKTKLLRSAASGIQCRAGNSSVPTLAWRNKHKSYLESRRRRLLRLLRAPRPARRHVHKLTGKLVTCFPGTHQPIHSALYFPSVLFLFRTARYRMNYLQWPLCLFRRQNGEKDVEFLDCNYLKGFALNFTIV